MDHLNAAFSGATCCNATFDWCDPGTCSVDTGLRFAWASLDDEGDVIEGSTVPDIGDAGACALRINAPKWTKVHTEGFETLHMKKKLRKGGANVLNVYWTSIYGEIGEMSGSSTFPYSYRHHPKSDGVLVRPEVITGGEFFPDYSEGDTLVHEVGHWLGLFHTFEGGCEVSDGISDTPKEKEPFLGCGDMEDFPIGRDSCPSDSGADPFSNYMNLADDRCMFEFTPDQVLVMQACYEIFRLNQKEERKVLSLTNGVPSDPIFLVHQERQIFSMEASSPVRCTTSAEEGRYSFYLKWGRRPFFFPFLNNCFRFSRDGTTSCRANFLRLGRRTVFASVKTYRTPLTNMTITCTEQ
jgi:hypothetical protein